MHATTLFSAHRRGPARVARARLRPAPSAGKHRTRVASMSGTHLSLPPQRNPRALRFADDVHRALPCTGDQGCCARSFPRRPVTRRPGDIADDCLGAVVDRYVLKEDLVLAFRSVSLERLHLSSKRSHQFVERTLGAVALSQTFGVGEAIGETHNRRVGRSHLAEERRFNRIPGLALFDERKHVLDSQLVDKLLGSPRIETNVLEIAACLRACIRHPDPQGRSKNPDL
jgi:hypothetical protein